MRNLAGKCYVKNVSGSWELEYSDNFEIIEDEAPSFTSISHYPTVPYETQAIAVNISATDNNHLDKIEIYWDDGSLHQQSVALNIDNSEYNGQASIGVFASGQVVEVWAVATDESGNVTESDRIVLNIQAEIVSVPGCPNGPQYLMAGIEGEYTTQGSTSSLGNLVQYRFDWGGGMIWDFGIVRLELMLGSLMMCIQSRHKRDLSQILAESLPGQLLCL